MQEKDGAVKPLLKETELENGAAPVIKSAEWNFRKQHNYARLPLVIHFPDVTPDGRTR